MPVTTRYRHSALPKRNPRAGSEAGEMLAKMDLKRGKEPIGSNALPIASNTQAIRELGSVAPLSAHR
jgi:hypothetical protein